MAAERAPGKLNLYLEVVGRRVDGYHDLRTLFLAIDLCDDVEVVRTSDDDIECTVRSGIEGGDDDVEGFAGAVAPEGPDNLAWRAARAYLDRARLEGGVRIDLTKRVPVGGGLGGGSSDAAAVLRALESNEKALGPAETLRIARDLGADVPFFLHGRAARGLGRGDVVEALPAPPPLDFVLALPPLCTETGRVFAHVAERIRRAPEGGLEAAEAALASGDPARVRAAHHNDLAEAAIRAYPDLLRFTSDVERRLGRPPCMSGSGSTLFDVPDAGGTQDVLARLAGLRGRVLVVRPLPARTPGAP